MAINDPKALLRRLAAGLDEGPWLEFKHNNDDCEMIARTLSACANAAMLADRDRAFMIWGIKDGSREKVGTDIRLSKLKKGGENLTNWLSRMIEPRLQLEFLDFEDGGMNFSIITIEPTYDRPVRFAGQEYIRIGENVKSLKEYPVRCAICWNGLPTRR
jgi:ATP-dependent DNA helicase RecG